MGQNENDFNIKCAFCGETNEFTKEEIYNNEKGSEIFREKYCLECNEPLTMKCPSCSNIFNVDANFRKNHLFKVLDTFWNPTPSPLDELIPKTAHHWKEYENQAATLTSETFRLSQKKFLEAIPSLITKLQELDQILTELSQIPEISVLEKASNKVLKGIQMNIEECGSILASVEEETKAVSEKKEKRLKKHVSFLDMQPNFHDFIEKVKKIRDQEISTELDSLKPGLNKVKEYIKQDPTFYRNICPICRKMIFTVNHQIYTMGISDDKLTYVRNLAEYYQQAQPEDSLSYTLKMNVMIHIEKDQIYDFHGDIAFVLQENEIEIIGRDKLREIEYEEEESEEILFDENDPLARVSNKQFSVTKKGNQIILAGMEFDAGRIGIFFKTLDHDIRKEDPEGIAIKSGDSLIIPLTKEANNPNYVEITIQ